METSSDSGVKIWRAASREIDWALWKSANEVVTFSFLVDGRADYWDWFLSSSCEWDWLSSSHCTNFECDWRDLDCDVMLTLFDESTGPCC